MTPSPLTQLVMLGTGTPNAEADRAGSSLAIVVGNMPCLVDFGPGVVRRAMAARQQGIAALSPQNLTLAFLTHLHSDHTLGYPDLIFTPWTLERTQPLRVFGPPGTQLMTRHILQAWQADIQERLNGLEPANSSGYRVEVTEIEAGKVYQDALLRVDAFPARHGSWPAFGYRFTTPGGVIVVSGDTAPHPQTIKHYADCDILVHEVYSQAGFQTRPARWQRYHASVHTSTKALAKIARQVQPNLLVLTHQLFWGQSAAELVAEIKADYNGKVVSARDLDVFTL